MPATLSEHSVRGLVALEWQFINLDVGVGELLDSLALMDLPEAAQAVEDVQALRLRLRHVLNRLDAPITCAVEQYQTLAEAPF